MNHGTATSNITIDGVVSQGDQGIITAYLPDDNIFGVFFGEGRWHTFEMDEAAFHKSFKVELNDASKPAENS